MKTMYAFIALLLLLNTSCNSTPKMTPLEYNDSIINAQTDIVKVILKFNSNDGTDIDGMDKIREEIISQCDSSIQKVSTMPDYDGDVAFRNAAVELFHFYKDISGNEYKKMIEIIKKGEFTPEDLEVITKIQTEIQAKESGLDSKFQSAQKAFSQKNNIQIGTNEYQQKIDELN